MRRLEQLRRSLFLELLPMIRVISDIIATSVAQSLRHAMVSGALLSVFLCLGDCQAQITADRTVVHWRANQPPVLNTTVRNGGEHTLLVETELVRVLQPGSPEETRVPADDMVVTPKKAAIPAGSERLVRLLFKGKRSDAEQVYRLNLVPRDSEVPIEPSSDGKSSVQLRILTGVGLLIFIEPATPKPDLSWERLEHAVRFRNNGNVNVLVTLVKVCPKSGSVQTTTEATETSDESDCTTLPGKRLYPGQEAEFPIDPGSTFKFRKRIGDEGVNLEIP